MLTRLKRWLFTLAPVKFSIRKSKHIVLPGFSNIPLYDVLRFLFRQLGKVSLTEKASAIAFNFVMAIPPAFIFLFTLVPYLPISQQLIDELFQLVRDIIPGQKNNSAVISFLSDFISNPRSGLLSIGFLLSLFYSSNAVMGIMRSFDKDSIIFKKRTALQKRKTAILVTLVLYVIILVTVSLLVAQGAVLEWLGVKSRLVRIFLIIIRFVLIVALFLSAISLIYRYTPSLHKRWRLFNPGSILACILMIASTMGFSFYVTNFGNYNKLYGSIGTVLILMLIIYINSLVLLVGFELNLSIRSLKLEADERSKLETLHQAL